MTREDFRRELGDAIDSISGSPGADLSERVRSALAEAPERHDQVWIAALAAAVIAVLLVAVLLVGNPLNRQPTPGSHGTGAPTISPASGASPSPNPSSTPSPQFVCSASSAFITSQSPPPLAFVDAVRTGAHGGYDRLTIEFKNGQTGTIELRPQAGTTFTTDPKGDQVTLLGQDGLLVKIEGADAHTAYSGPTDIKTGYAGLLEVRKVGDFEGVVQWALGLSKPACYQATILTNPARLVIEIQTGQ